MAVGTEQRGAIDCLFYKRQELMPKQMLKRRLFPYMEGHEEI